MFCLAFSVYFLQSWICLHHSTRPSTGLKARMWCYIYWTFLGRASYLSIYLYLLTCLVRQLRQTVRGWIPLSCQADLFDKVVVKAEGMNKPEFWTQNHENKLASLKFATAQGLNFSVHSQIIIIIIMHASTPPVHSSLSWLRLLILTVRLGLSLSRSSCCRLLLYTLQVLLAVFWLVQIAMCIR